MSSWPRRRSGEGLLENLWGQGFGDKFLCGMAEGAGFEPTFPFRIPVFKTGAISRSATPPDGLSYLDTTGVLYDTGRPQWGRELM